MNHKCVCKTAPATQGLLTMSVAEHANNLIHVGTLTVEGFSL